MIGDFNGDTLGHRTHAQSATARFWLGNSFQLCSNAQFVLIHVLRDAQKP